MSAKSNAPVIIKRKKVIAGGGHHGGAWKVAYADFVTAMMAFFMLMWLLNATTEVQRKGIADYFNPTIPINRISGGGDGMFGGDDLFSENTLARSGTGATQRKSTDELKARGDTGSDKSLAEDTGSAERDDTLEKVEDMLSARRGESMVSPETARHIVTRVTDEGLIIELFDLENATLFEPETVDPTPLLADILAIVAPVFGLVKNEVAVNGYAAARPVVVADSSVWGVSARRADRVRLMLEGAGLAARRVQRVTGFADRKPATGNPMAVRNNRIEIVLLRQQ